jgi:triacylglycerol lipase
MRNWTCLVVIALLAGCEGFSQTNRGAEAGRGVIIVLAHGFGANRDLGFSQDIVDALVDDGYTVFKTEVPAMGPVIERGAALAEQINAIADDYGGELHLIGHSMGGLDSRYAISTLGVGDVVASLTTIASPHRGSPLADYVLEDTVFGPSTLEILQNILGQIAPSGDDEATRAAVVDLSEAAAPAFNAANPDEPGVRYISWAGLATVGGAESANAGSCGSSAPAPDSLGIQFVPIASIVGKGDADLAHDGLVPVDSAVWGDFRGCVSADHLDEVGVALDDAFDAPAFFRDVAAYAVSP